MLVRGVVYECILRAKAPLKITFERLVRTSIPSVVLENNVNVRVNVGLSMWLNVWCKYWSKYGGKYMCKCVGKYGD